MPPPNITPEKLVQLKTQLQQDWQRWMSGQPRFPQAIQRLPLSLLNQLLSFQTTDELTNIARELNLSAQTRNKLGELMWQYAIYRDASAVIPKLGVDEAAANRIVAEIKHRIFRETSEPRLEGNVVDLKTHSPQTPPNDYNR